MFSIVASAAGSTGTQPSDTGGVKAGVQTTDEGRDNNYNTVNKSNANQTGSKVGTNDGTTFGDVIKSDDIVKGTDGSHGTQRTHGEYMNNTNSCASCHQTHTGASEGLLFKDGEYATCTACHDGTLGFYNVMGAGSNSAGTFGGTHDGNMSAHLANGSVKLSAAPGGNNKEIAGVGGEWTEEFTCANCHAPHGSYSDRLLHEDPNGMGNTLIEDGGKKLEGVPVIDKDDIANLTTKYTGTGANVTYSDATGTSHTENYIVFRFNIGDTVQPTNKNLVKDPVTKKWVDGPVNYYNEAGLQSGDVVLQLMKWVPTLDHDGKDTGEGKYVSVQDPFLHEYDFDSSHTKHYWTAFYDGSVFQNTDPTNTTTYNEDGNFDGKLIDIVHTDSLKNGEILGKGFLGVRDDSTKYTKVSELKAAVNSVTTGNIARGYVVKFAKTVDDASKNTITTDVSALWNSQNAKYISGNGVAISTWCASCHTDYLASSGQKTGTFDHAYRHTTNSDSYTCVRCHYAHGTDVTIMRDACGLTYNDILKGLNGGSNYFTSKPYNATTGADNSQREALVKDYLIDKNPDSALKRYTNMAVCWGCHTSSHSGGTRNTDSYQYNPTPGVDTDRNGITDY